MTRSALRVVLCATTLVAGVSPAVGVTKESIGRSVSGRPILLYRVGDVNAPRTVLVVGCIHGNECAAFPVIGRLVRGAPIPGVQLLVIPSVNPDGRHADTRGNANGVDLNRNFPTGWRRIPKGSPYYSGPRPFSEPETRLVRDLIRSERPATSIWFHQPETNVRDNDAAPQARRYAAMVGLPFLRLAVPPGTATAWTKRVISGAVAFAVELPGRGMTVPEVRRHHAAVRSAAAG